MDTHDKLDQAGQGQQEEDGGEGHMVGEVDALALLPLELDLAVAGPVEALPMSGTVSVAAFGGHVGVLVAETHLVHHPGQPTTHKGKGTRGGYEVGPQEAVHDIVKVTSL